MPILGIYAASVQKASTAFESIASATPNTVGTVTFSSIPQTYSSLQIRVSKLDNSGNSNFISLQFNSDTGGNYIWHNLYGTSGGAVGAFAGTTSSTAISLTGTGLISSTCPQVAIIDIHDYASTAKNKTARIIGGLGTNGAGGGERVSITSGLWKNTNAISSIDLSFSSGTFASGTTIALYGVK